MDTQQIKWPLLKFQNGRFDGEIPESDCFDYDREVEQGTAEEDHIYQELRMQGWERCTDYGGAVVILRKAENGDRLNRLSTQFLILSAAFTPAAHYPIYCPTFPDFLEFMRLYGLVLTDIHDRFVEHMEMSTIIHRNQHKSGADLEKVVATVPFRLQHNLREQIRQWQHNYRRKS